MDHSRRRKVRLDDVICFGDQKEKYDQFFAREHISTCWPNYYELHSFCVFEEISRLFTGIGVQSILDFQVWPSYKALTSEFLSSFSFDGDAVAVSGTMTFRLGNEARSLTIAEFNEILKFPSNSGFRVVEKKALSDFWYAITDSSFLGRDANESEIVNSCLRILHRILVNVIFARSEGGNVGVGDLTILWCLDNACFVDLGWFFAEKCDALSGSSRGDICIGGMVTILVDHFGFDHTQYNELVPTLKIDRDHLIHTRILKNAKMGLAHFRFRQTARTYTDHEKVDCMCIEKPENLHEAWVGHPRPKRVLDNVLIAQEEPAPGLHLLLMTTHQLRASIWMMIFERGWLEWRPRSLICLSNSDPSKSNTLKTG